MEDALLGRFMASIDVVSESGDDLLLLGMVVMGCCCGCCI